MEQIKVRNVIGDPIKFTIGDGISIDEIIKASEIPEQLLPQIVVLNHGLMIKEWSYITHPGDQLTICVRPTGGGGGGGKGILGAIASIAVVVAAIALAAPTGGASLWLAGATGFSAATASAILTVGFTMVGMMAVSALIPPPSTNGQTGSGGYDSYQESQGYSLSGQSNGAKVYQSVPVIYGTYKVYPNVCATPRIESTGKVTNLAAAYDFGLGDVDVTDIRIGDQPYAQLGTQIEIFQNTKTPAFKHISNLQAADQFAYILSANSVTIRTKASSSSASVVLSLGRGLCYYNNSGNPENASFNILAEYRQVGSTTWTPIPASQFRCSDISVSDEPGGEVKITGATTRPNVFNIDITFPAAGEYEIRIDRTGASSTDNRTVNDLQLAQLKSYKVGEVVKLDHKHTMIEFYAQASDKLTGVVQNLSAICHKKIRYCNATGWSGSGRTSNPAYIALDILTHEANPQPLADAQIDFASFKRLADICDTDVTRTINGKAVIFKRFEFNGVLDQAMTVQEAVNNVLINARAQLCIMQSGKFGVFIDDAKTTPKQLITPANSWNFSGNRSFPIYPDALRVSFVEPDLQWARAEIIVYADGKNESNAETFEQLELNGITNYAQAWCQGRFYMAEGRFRSELFSVTMDIENLVVIRGDLVAVQHDVPKMGGLACRVVSNVAGVITLDQDFALPSNAGYTVRLMDGTIKTGAIASSTGNTVTLAVADPAIGFDDLFVLGERNKVTRNYLVMGVEPSNDLTATLTLCPYVPGVYTADQGTIPDWDPGFGMDLITGTDLAVQNLAYIQTISHIDRNPFADIKLTWTTTGNLGTLKEYQIYGTLPDGTRQLLGTTDGATFNWNLDLLAHKDWWNKNIKYEVIPVNTIGTSGTSATTTNTLVPDQETPLDPTGYGVNIIDNSLVEIFWHKSRASDIAYYEVRYSPEVINAVWGASQKLATVSWDTTRTTAGARTGTYMLQAVDTSGNRGNVLSLRTSVENLPKLDLLHIVDESATWPGTLTDMNMSLGEPTIDGAFGAVKNRGVYNYKEIFDAGSIDELRFQSKIKGYGVTADDFMVKWVPLSIATPLAKATSSDYDIWLEVATADDYDVMASTRWNPLSNVIPLGMAGFNWKPWRRVESVDLTGRFFKFRIIAESYNPNVNVRLVSSIVEIDVLERIIAQNDLQVTNAAGGLLVSFNPPFRTTPALAINVDGNTKAINYELVSKSNSQAVVRLIDITTGTPTTGQIDVSALGWGKIRTSSL